MAVQFVLLLSRKKKVLGSIQAQSFYMGFVQMLLVCSPSECMHRLGTPGSSYSQKVGLSCCL